MLPAFWKVPGSGSTLKPPSASGELWSGVHLVCVSGNLWNVGGPQMGLGNFLWGLRGFRAQPRLRGFRAQTLGCCGTKMSDPWRLSSKA